MIKESLVRRLEILTTKTINTSRHQYLFLPVNILYQDHTTGKVLLKVKDI